MGDPVTVSEAQLTRLLEAAKPKRKPANKPTKFSGKPSDGQDIRTWLEDVDCYATEAGLADGTPEKGRTIFRFLSDPARKEIRNELGSDPTDGPKIREHLIRIFASSEDYASLQQEYSLRYQLEGEDLSEYGRELKTIHRRLMASITNVDQKTAMEAVSDASLIAQFTAGVNVSIQQDVRRVALAYEGKFQRVP